MSFLMMDPPQSPSLYSTLTQMDINRINSFNFLIQIARLEDECSNPVSTFHLLLLSISSYFPSPLTFHLLAIHFLAFHLLIKNWWELANWWELKTIDGKLAAAGFKPMTYRSNAWWIKPLDHGVLPHYLNVYFSRLCQSNATGCNFIPG